MDASPAHRRDAGFTPDPISTGAANSRAFTFALVAAVCLAVGFLGGVAWTLAAVGAPP